MKTWRDQGDLNERRSISMTASRSETSIGPIVKGWGALLSAMDAETSKLSGPGPAGKRRPGDADGRGGREDRRPQLGDALPRVRRDEHGRRAPPARAPALLDEELA